MTEYDYTKSPVAVDRLVQEIQLSAIVTVLDHVSTLDSALSIFFVSDLSAGDKTILDTIVANHSGIGLATDFIKVTATANTSTSSSSYLVLNSMSVPPLIGGSYLLFFRGNFSTNVPLLSQPGVMISIFNDGVQITDSELTEVSTDSNAPFDMVTVAQFVVANNKVVDVRWKTNGAGNTISCINRMLCLARQK